MGSGGPTMLNHRGKNVSNQQPETLHGDQAQQASAFSQNRQWPFLIAVGGLISVVAIAAAVNASRESTSAAARPSASAQTPSTAAGGVLGEDSMTGTALLHYLADHMSESAADRTIGLYTHITTLLWARAETEISRQRLESWHTVDGQQHMDRRAELPPVPANGFETATADFASLVAAPLAEISANGVGPADIELPAGSDALHELTVELQRRQPNWSTEPATLRIDAITGLYRQQYVTPKLRAAALNLLADQGEFTHQRVTDHAGRDGIAFTLIDNGSRWTLAFDPGSGQLLAYERWAITDDKLDTYAVIVTVERTDLTPSPASPAAASTIGPPTQWPTELRHPRA